MPDTSKGSAADHRDPASDQVGVEELAQAADRLFYAMRRSRAATVGRSAAGLSMAQLALLVPLTEDAGGDGLPVGRLATNADISVPTATRMLKQLEANGVVTRRRSEQDERQVLIRLTDDGTRRLTTMRTELRARQSRALSQFTPEERHTLAAQLHRLAGIIADTMTGPEHH
ncbi:MarR family transcriptional regulator [Streptomyces sp. BHT-5-2]|uniref:MarR family winged helix-turn-helix transcriptional regulator n=1 Tax=Streptomyces sp. BHT-5-2 TaxID=2866715 RepID=UPI001C8DC2F2|nr:MarR family transcriptional regulator [Streptomyces sp. BHT-5-2]QZL04914.1 MarR family transcriptional regulator [Streptomyces sp. BHT-5-2]